MNKVQKIREYLVGMASAACCDAKTKKVIKANILPFIDLLQEEPVSERFAFKAIPRLLEMIEPTGRAKNYVAKLADALDSEGYYTDAKIVRESLKIMNGEKVPMATMDEELVREDLKAEIKSWLDEGLPNEEELVEHIKETACHFAKWQKEQDQETIEVAEDHAMLAGMEKMKEEMMAKAIDGEILEIEDNDCAMCSHTHLELFIEPDTLEENKLKDGDKVKVIVIKED